MGYFRTSQQTFKGDEATNTGTHGAFYEDETDVEEILSNSRTKVSLWGFGGNARVCLLESKLTAPQTIEANMSISHRTGFYVWTNEDPSHPMEEPDTADPLGADPNYYDLSVAAYAHFWEERPFGALRGDFPTGTAPLPPLHLVKGPGMAAAYRKSDLFLTADLNVLQGECIGSLQCVLEWKEDTEDDSAAGPAIEAACESLLVEERRTRNKEQNTRACAVAALAVLCVGGIRTHFGPNWSPWPRPSPRWAG